MKYCLAFIFTLFFWSEAKPDAQNIHLKFTPTYNHIPIHLSDGTYKTRDSSEIETFKCYISGIKLMDHNKLVWQEENSFHLLDAAEEKKMEWVLNLSSVIHFDQIIFKLGIDSLTNHSGILGADLDPAKGMYWAWQSGYINLKLEGTNPQCPTRKNEFQFHLGGYLSPYNCLQEIAINIPEQKNIDLEINLASFFEQIDLAKQNHIMSPGAAAVLLSQKAAKIFTLRS